MEIACFAQYYCVTEKERDWVYVSESVCACMDPDIANILQIWVYFVWNSVCM